MELDLPLLGALLLLVLPLLGALCVLLTGPVSRAIGRYQREEEQVVRAPLIVAGIVLLLEACLAIALRETPAVRDELRVAVGGTVLWVDQYTVGTIIALSVVTLLAIGGTDFYRSSSQPLPTFEVAAVLLVWGAHVVLAFAGSLQMAAFAIVFGSLAVSVVLLVEGWRQARAGRIVLVIGAVFLPLVAWLLLAPYRHLGSPVDLHEVRATIRMAHPALAHGMLARLWLAGGLLPAVAPLLIAAVHRKPPASHLTVPALFSAALCGAVPVLFRITAVAFPAGSPTFCHEWLSPRLGAVAVGLGILAVGVGQTGVSAFHKLCLIAFGQLCSLAWLAGVLNKTAAAAALPAAIGPGVLVSLCFGYMLASEKGAPPLRRAAPVLLFAFCWPWAWVGAIAARGLAGYTIAGTVLSVLLLVSGVRLSRRVARTKPDVSRLTVIPDSLASGRPAFRGESITRDVLLILALALVAALVAALWTPSVASLSPPLP